MDGRCKVCGDKFDLRSNCIDCTVCGSAIHKTKCAVSVKDGKKGDISLKCKTCQTKDEVMSTPTAGTSASTLSSNEEVLSEIRNLSKNFDVKFQLLQKIDGDLQSISTRVTNVESEQAAMTERMDSLQSAQDMQKAKMIDIGNSVKTATSTVEHLEEYGRRNTIEIHGIPLTNQENLFEIIKDLGEVLEVKIENVNIDAIHRLPSRANKNVIIVKFSNRWVCDAVKKNRLGKKLCTTMIGFDEPSTIYINVSLGKNKSYLAKETRRMFRSYNATVRVDDGGNIYVHKWFETLAEAKQNRDKKCLVKSSAEFSQIINQLELSRKVRSNE